MSGQRVRVWRMDLAPGEASDFHEHTLPYIDPDRAEGLAD
jgi:hypothetical protein